LLLYREGEQKGAGKKKGNLLSQKGIKLEPRGGEGSRVKKAYYEGKKSYRREQPRTRADNDLNFP